MNLSNMSDIRNMQVQYTMLALLAKNYQKCQLIFLPDLKKTAVDILLC